MRLQLIQPFADAMCQHDGQGKVFFCFIGGVAHHDALIARANGCARLRFPYGIGNVRGLVMDADFQFHLVIGAFAEMSACP